MAARTAPIKMGRFSQPLACHILPPPCIHAVRQTLCPHTAA